MTSSTFFGTLEVLNETLTASIVIVSVSILLYNLPRYAQNRVTRAFVVVLLCVILTYVGDVFTSLDKDGNHLEVWLRFQWFGIAFIPAALFHLSDALLATTGRPSRGRRKIVVRISYAISAIITFLALFTDTVVNGTTTGNIPHMDSGPAFLVYVAYLTVVGMVSMINVIRARRRCLTRYTRRRMTYLLSVFLSPVYGVFPYSLVFKPLGDTNTTTLLIILNLANLIMMLMLIFMAYPLSFFGSEKPDRIIKTQVLEFMLRGPLTAAAVLAVVLFLPRMTNVLGFNGETIMPFVAVAVLLLLEWSITLFFPALQRLLIYTKDQDRTQWIQSLSDRLLTPTDAEQLLESILAALCDQLRVPTAFVARVDTENAELVQVVGSLAPSQEALAAPELFSLVRGNGELLPEANDHLKRVGDFFVWRSYWLTSLHYSRPSNNGTHSPTLGILGIWARAPEPDLIAEEIPIFQALSRQAAQVLEDLQLQSEVFVALEGLASRMDAMQQLRGVSRYGHVSQLPSPSSDVLSRPDFSDLVWDALRDYWGGPKLTQSELLKLNIVWREMEQTDHNPVRALRTVLAQAIENLKPEGQRSLTTSEWILYNILEMRFLQGRKVRDVALRLAMSDSDLYRKQRVAIEEVARQIAEMERNILSSDTSPSDNNSSV